MLKIQNSKGELLMEITDNGETVIHKGLVVKEAEKDGGKETKQECDCIDKGEPEG